MFTLERARRLDRNAGDPLPVVFQSLAARGVHIRRGQFTLIAAAPGVGKSLFALTVALGCGSPGIYMSADTDAQTMYVRAGAMLTGWRTVDIETAISAGNTRMIDARMEAHRHLRFDFAARITPDLIEEQTMAYAATYGEWPHVVIIDNLSNVDMEDGGEGYQALESACEYLHELGRETGAAILGLHHVTGEYDDGTKPVPLSGLRGKVSKVPEVVLTLYKNNAGQLYVCPVKNRTGRADSSAGWSIPLAYDPERMSLADMPALPGLERP